MRIISLFCLIGIGCGNKDAEESVAVCVDASSTPDTDSLSGCKDLLGSTIYGPSMSIPQSTDIVIRGTLTPTSDITVYQVFVAGIPATSDAFDFSSWSATVPYDLLQNDVEPMTGKASLTVAATSNCETGQTLLGTLGVLVVAPDLNIKPIVTYQNQLAKYLPADGVTSANISIMPADVDMTSIAADNGSLTNVVLTHPASAMLTAGKKVGNAVVTADAQGQVGSAIVPLLGAPILVPGGAELLSGESLTVSVLGGNTLLSCMATGGLDITYLGATIVGSAGAENAIADGTIQLKVRAAAGATTSEITCVDLYGQVVKGAFSVAP